MTEWLDGPARSARGIRVVAVRGGQVVVRPDRIVGEEPMEIRAVGPGGAAPVSVAVTMRTPGHDTELAVGFLVTEGLIAPGDVVRTTVGDVASLAQPENEVTVHLARALDPAAISGRNFVASASCGICGKASLDQVAVRCDPPAPGPVVAPAMLVALPSALRSAQELFEATGGIHAAGLFDAKGTLLLLREDVGRHNALDKVVGAAALAGDLPPEGPGPAGVRPGELRDRAEGGGCRHPDRGRDLRPQRPGGRRRAPAVDDPDRVLAR